MKYKITREDERKLLEAYYVLDRICNGYHIPLKYKNVPARVNEQLAEKDKEIEALKEDCNASIKIVREVQEKITRHLVCEEIGQTLNEYIDTHRWQWENKGRHEIVKIPNCVIREILRKVEKGE